MLLDMQALFCEDQAVTASAASSNVIDLGTGDAGNSEGGELLLLCSEDAAAAGAATVNVALQTDDAEDFSGAVTVAESGAIAKADLVAGSEHFKIRLPRGMKKYARLYFTVTTGPLTAGKFTAAIIDGRDAGFGA